MRKFLNVLERNLLSKVVDFDIHDNLVFLGRSEPFENKNITNTWLNVLII